MSYSNIMFSIPIAAGCRNHCNVPDCGRDHIVWSSPSFANIIVKYLILDYVYYLMPPTGVWCAWWLGYCISNCCQFNYSSRSSSSSRDAGTSELGWGGPLSARVATWVVVCTLRSMRTALLLLRRTSSAELHSAASPLSSCQHLRSFHRYVHDRCYVQSELANSSNIVRKDGTQRLSVDLIW